ncbi:hypothetical protein BIW11_12204 [Tropilaelaps mercedesae]|uniref:Uncharacterized protein n=1 Tax=Tropilaelaps mercedesae TaxID=418985 RepID=A0A1V9X7Z5_9ACAR|nr:hypothetical protein BIW11_12204 [Tropilaelaps mercedesae]
MPSEKVTTRTQEKGAEILLAVLAEDHTEASVLFEGYMLGQYDKKHHHHGRQHHRKRRNTDVIESDRSSLAGRARFPESGLPKGCSSVEVQDDSCEICIQRSGCRHLVSQEGEPELASLLASKPRLDQIGMYRYDSDS